MFRSSQIDFFEQLELSIVNLGKVFITGDMDSRTSNSPDYFEFDKYIDYDLFYLNANDVPNRTNKDRIIDYNGIRLLDLCQATGLLIANGRLLNDNDQGKYTN